MTLGRRLARAMERWEEALRHSQGAESSVQRGLRFELTPRQRSDGSLELSDRGIVIPLMWAGLALPFVGIAIYLLSARIPVQGDLEVAVGFFAIALVCVLVGVGRFFCGQRLIVSPDRREGKWIVRRWLVHDVTPCLISDIGIAQFDSYSAFGRLDGKRGVIIGFASGTMVTAFGCTESTADAHIQAMLRVIPFRPDKPMVVWLHPEGAWG